MGMSSAIALNHAGLAQIMVVDISDFRLAKAAALGFETCNSSTEDLEQKIKDTMGTISQMFSELIDVDIYVDATGIAAIPKLYQQFGRPGSVLSVVGIHH